VETKAITEMIAIKSKQTMPYPLVANQTNPLTTSLLPHFSWLMHLFIGYQKQTWISVISDLKSLLTLKQTQTSADI
jgi:hypothetical protein